MSKVPFGRFITTFLLFSKNVRYIVDKLSAFGYQVADEEVSDIFSKLKSILPEKYKEIVDKGEVFPSDSDWLKQLGVFEFYDFIARGKSEIDNPPDYFKWCKDCMWIHGYKDVMVIVNILLFNQEDLGSISKIISYKYRKKISIDALELYKKVFWDCESLTAKEALHYCKPFKNNALIVRNLRSGTEAEMLLDSEGNDGSDVPFTFHDASYIKWKIGYHDVLVPAPKDFLDRIKTDSYFKYYETMNMSQSIEIEEEDGENEKLGSFNSTKRKRRNVEEQRVKLAKCWIDLYLKAKDHTPSEGHDKENFFERMEQLELGFEEEKIARIDDMPEIMEDIRTDVNP